MTDDLTSLPGRVQAELTRLRAERLVFTAEQDRLKARLAETEQELQGLVADARELAGKERRIAELGDRVELLERDHRGISRRAQALTSDVATARRERDVLRAELTSCREERDRLRLALVDAELAISAGKLDQGGPVGQQSVDAQRALLAERRASEFAQELAATRQTVSWRVTRPLRAVRRKINMS